MDMEELMAFFQFKLEKSMPMDDNHVIESLEACMAELKRAKMDVPAPASDASELPSRPFGLFVPPSVEQRIGRRTLESDHELIRGKRATYYRESRMSISIPPDGGPEFVEGELHVGASIPEIGETKSIYDNVPEESVEDSKDPHAKREAYARQRPLRIENSAPDRAVGNGGHNQAAMMNGSVPSAGSRPKSKGPLSPDKVKQYGGGQTEFKFREMSDSVAPQQYGVTMRL